MIIKSIQIPGYNGGEAIRFHDTQEDLIEFYLATHSSGKKTYNKNISINCILGDNGAGKTRFLGEINKFFTKSESELTQPSANQDNYSIIFSDKSQSYIQEQDVQGGYGKINKLYKIPTQEAFIRVSLLDDYFFGSKDRKKSVNYDFIKNTINNPEIGLSRFYLQINNLLQKESHFYLQINNLLQKKSHLNNILASYVNLKDAEILLDDIEINFDWYDVFGGSHISFLENESRESLRDFIDEELWNLGGNANERMKQIFALFTFLYNRSANIEDQEYQKNHKNLYKLFSPEQALDHWRVLSDLFIAFIHRLRMDINFVIYSDIHSFSQLKGYAKFKKSLEMLQFFIEKNKSDFSLEKELNKDSFLSQTELSEYINHGLDSITNTLKVFEKLEKEELDQKEIIEVISKAFNISDIETFLRFISGYEYYRVGANKHFLVVLLTGYKKDDEIGKNEMKKILNTFQHIIYSRFRNPTKEAMGRDAKIKIDTPMVYTQDEQLILSFPFYKLDLLFRNQLMAKSFSGLSSGEKSILARFTNTYTHLIDKCPNSEEKYECIILIDEPDLHLHLDWQRQYIAKLIDTFSTVPENIKMQFIIATHSPFIISDLPKENIIRIKKDDNGNTMFIDYGEGKNEKTNSFSANYVDLIQNGFFDDQILMGSFAERVINGLAIAEKKNVLGDNFQFTADQKLIEQYVKEDTNKNKIEKMKKQIGDDFLRSHLLYF